MILVVEMHEKLEEEHRDLRIKFFEMKQKHDDIMDKMSFFSQVFHFVWNVSSKYKGTDHYFEKN